MRLGGHFHAADWPFWMRICNQVLVVDDLAINRLGTVVLLRQFNYAVDEAENGFEAIKKFETGAYAAILMDIQMPGMSGLECTQKIRALESGSGRKIAIIGFTSCRDFDIEQQCIAAGMNAYLDKECSADQLDATLKENLVMLIG